MSRESKNKGNKRGDKSTSHFFAMKAHLNTLLFLPVNSCLTPFNFPLFLLSLCLILPLFQPTTLSGEPGRSNPTAPMLPTTYAGQELNEEWLWSEKLDGIRGEWTGTAMLTKQGNPIDVPRYFTKNFPPFPLSGEIWGGRQTFEHTSSIVATAGEDKGWSSLRFGIFDAPDAELPIKQRLARAANWFVTHPSRYAFIIEQKPLQGREHLQQLLQEIEQAGGEGIVLVRKGAKYQNGRSVDILKVKNFNDTEAVVVGYVPGKGKHKGRMGSLIVELYHKRSIQFKIGTGFDDKQRENPPPIGAIITFKYTGFYKSGKPKFPSFLRVRSLTGEMM
ncbi:MAG: DNA ligase [Desulfobulbus propionicus]|nr:MAG: DNA ligase [Desulfobulbus propionicus]